MTDPRIEAAAKGIADRMSWASMHWGELHPDAYPHLAAAAIAAIDKAATITTVEELDALPAGTVILCASGWAAQKTDKVDQLWWRTWNEIEVRGGAINELPARVIHWGTE